MPGGSSQPKRLSNTQLMAACGGQPTIQEMLLRQRGRWVGHVLRMPEHRLASKFFFGTLDSSAPPQPLYKRPTLSSQYTADVANRFPRSELRKLETPCLIAAAHDKAFWRAHFP